MSANASRSSVQISDKALECQDQEFLKAADSSSGTIASARQLIGMTLERMGVAPEEPIEEGPSREVVVERLLVAAWSALTEPSSQMLYDGTSLIIHRIDRNGLLTTVSEKWCELLGYSATEVLGRPSVDFLSEQSKVEAKERWLPLFWKQGWLDSVPYTMIHRNGDRVDVSLSGVAERDANNEFSYSLAVINRRSPSAS